MKRFNFKLNSLLFIGVSAMLINIIFSAPVLADTIEKTSRESKDMVPFYFMLLIVGGCIAVTLSYVSWKKYKAEKKKQKQNGKSID